MKSGLYPTSICGVVYQNRHRYLACQFTFACEGKSLRITDSGAWVSAQRIASEVLDGKTYLADVGGATHYHADYVRPALGAAAEEDGRDRPPHLLQAAAGTDLTGGPRGAGLSSKTSPTARARLAPMAMVSPEVVLPPDLAAAGDVALFWRVPRHHGLDCLRAIFRRHSYARHTHGTYAVAGIMRGCETFYPPRRAAICAGGRDRRRLPGRASRRRSARRRLRVPHLLSVTRI